MWKWYEIQIPVSTNKVLLEHSHAHLLMAALVLQGQSWVVVTETIESAKPKIFTHWPFTVKNKTKQKTCQSFI